MKNYVSIPYAKLDAALHWAKMYCPTYITNAYAQDGFNGHKHINDLHIDFFFGTSEQGQKEMEMFALKWL